eukprot:12920854-Prorocentrum_lima.AAC.1
MWQEADGGYGRVEVAVGVERGCGAGGLGGRVARGRSPAGDPKLPAPMHPMDEERGRAGN